MKRVRINGERLVVGGVVPDQDDDSNLRELGFSLALDQRAFGPRRLLVAFGDAEGRFLGLAHARRTDPPERALEPCIDHLGTGAAIAIAYCDEKVTIAAPSAEAVQRFATAQGIAERRGIRLHDWFACDDENIRSMRLATRPDEQWWPSVGR